MFLLWIFHGVPVANLAELLAEGHVLVGFGIRRKRNLPQLFAAGEEPDSLSYFKRKVIQRCELLMQENMCGIMVE